MIRSTHSGGPHIGFSALFILGVILGFLWLAFTRDAVEDSTSGSSILDETNAMISALAAGLIGARMAFVGLHIPYYSDHPLEMLMLWQGGLSATGGIIGVLCGLLVYTRRQRAVFWGMLDLVAVPALILSITTWLGAWIDGAAYGIQVEGNSSLLVGSDPFGGTGARWPTQLTGMLLSLSNFLVITRLGRNLPVGITGTLTLSSIALTLVIVSLFRADPSLLLIGVRLDVFAPAGIVALGVAMTVFRFQKAI